MFVLIWVAGLKCCSITFLNILQFSSKSDAQCSPLDLSIPQNRVLHQCSRTIFLPWIYRKVIPIFIEEETNQKGELSYARSQDCSTQEPEFETKSVWLQNTCSFPKPQDATSQEKAENWHYSLKCVQKLGQETPHPPWEKPNQTKNHELQYSNLEHQRFWVPCSGPSHALSWLITSVSFQVRKSVIYKGDIDFREQRDHIS